MQKYTLILKMQNNNKKNIIIFILLLHVSLLVGQQSPPQSQNNQLKSNNLAQKKIDLIKSISSGSFFSKNYLELAFIHEKEGNIPQTLFYLTRYYQANPSKLVANKIKQMANINQLKGFENLESFQSSPLRTTGLIIFLLAVTFLVIVFITKKMSITYLGTSAGLCLVALLCINLSQTTQRAIISKKCFLMDSPSAGPKNLGIIEEGNCVKVLTKKNNWIQVEYQQTIGYIRQPHLKPI